VFIARYNRLIFINMQLSGGSIRLLQRRPGSDINYMYHC